MARLICLNDEIAETGNSDNIYVRGTLVADAVSTLSGTFGSGGNDVVISSTGVLLEGTATQWDDLRIPGNSIPAGASAPDLVQFLGAGGLKVYGFDGGVTSEQLFFSIQLPHGYKAGSDIHPHVHWCPTTAGAGTVEWSLEYSWVNINGVFGASQTVRATPQAAAGTAWTHQLIEIADIVGTGKTLSSMLICRLFRDPTRDTYGDDAGLLEIDFHYEIDAFGSREEYVK